jgi:hypothetical protein
MKSKSAREVAQDLRVLAHVGRGSGRPSVLGSIAGPQEVVLDELVEGVEGERSGGRCGRDGRMG